MILLKILLKKLVSSSVILFAFSFSGNVFAEEELSKADEILNGVISDFVTDLIDNPDSPLSKYILSMMIGFTFIGLAWHTIAWALKKYELEELIAYVFIVIFTWGFYVNYNYALSEICSWADAIGSGIQTEAVGESDPIFAGAKMSEALENIRLKDISIFSGLAAWWVFFQFQVVLVILKIIIFVMNAWGVWGYAFSKITGLLFLPLLLVPFTRKIFDKWFQIFLGFWFFHLFAKIALSLYYLYFFAIFGVLDSPIEFNPVADSLAANRIILHLFIGIFFMLAVGGMSAAMASGFGGITSKASNAAMKVATTVVKMI